MGRRRRLLRRGTRRLRARAAARAGGGGKSGAGGETGRPSRPASHLHPGRASSRAGPRARLAGAVRGRASGQAQCGASSRHCPSQTLAAVAMPWLRDRPESGLTPRRHGGQSAPGGIRPCPRCRSIVRCKCSGIRKPAGFSSDASLSRRWPGTGPGAECQCGRRRQSLQA